MSDFLNRLNKEQKKAAEHIDGALLILAGAGTGKTQTMISRIVYLITQVGISAESILSLTFTNKAAASMQNRAVSMLKEENYEGVMPTLSTFHSFGVWFLNEYSEYLKDYRDVNYQIIEPNQKKEIIEHLVKLNMQSSLQNKSKEDIKEEKQKINDFLKSCVAYIEQCKSALIYDENSLEHKYYLLYENELKIRNYIDFDDLIILPYLILKNNPKLAKEVSLRFNYICVDEYQDTNLAQLKLLKMLCVAHQNIVVVGDDDQSIYSFRYARVENILEFQKDFKNAKIIKLEQNYRSTQNILDTANNLISHNKNRYGKTLFTDNDKGLEIEFLHTYNSVCDEIKRLLKNNVDYEEICILYRANYASNNIEPRLIDKKIAYKVIGTLPFFQKAEIKIVINYLRFLINNDDDILFKKIINTPKRGFGDKKIELLEKYAKEHNISLFAALKENQNIIKNSNSISEFIDIFNIKEQDQNIIFQQKIKNLAIENMYDNPVNRAENITTFFNMLYKECSRSYDKIKLIEFLNNISLQEKIIEEKQSAINLMSIHASKGLEFDYVFLIDCENTKMPPIYADNSEEERRLAYVAITRAKKKFYCQYDESNPSIYIQQMRINTKAKITKNSSFNVGDRVFHKIFQNGIVIKSSEDKSLVDFDGMLKNISNSFLKLAENDEIYEYDDIKIDYSDI